MDFEEIRFIEIADSGDERGGSFEVPDRASSLLGVMSDAHITTLRPGCVRGNHYHVARDELIIVYASDSWTFCWDEGEGTQIDAREFGPGCVLVEIARGWAHAVLNSGTNELFLVALTTGSFQIDEPDAYRRVVTINALNPSGPPQNVRDT